MELLGVLMAWSALVAVVAAVAVVAWTERRRQMVALRVRARPAYRGERLGRPARDHLDPPWRDCGD